MIFGLSGVSGVGCIIICLFTPRWLFRDGLLPEQTYFVGFARSDLTVDAIRTACLPHMQVKLDLILNIVLISYTLNCLFPPAQVTDTEADRLSTFFSRNSYISGKYADGTSFSKLNSHILSLPGASGANRLFYLALPPTVYHDVTRNIKEHCMSTKSVQTLLWSPEFCFLRDFNTQVDFIKIDGRETLCTHLYVFVC